MSCQSLSCRASDVQTDCYAANPLRHSARAMISLCQKSPRDDAHRSSTLGTLKWTSERACRLQPATWRIGAMAVPPFSQLKTWRLRLNSRPPGFRCFQPELPSTPQRGGGTRDPASSAGRPMRQRTRARSNNGGANSPMPYPGSNLAAPGSSLLTPIDMVGQTGSQRFLSSPQTMAGCPKGR